MNQKTSAAVRDVEIKEEPTALNKILKFENVVQSGGEAKFAVSEGLVRVNGVVETRKRRKIMSGDIIQFEGTLIRVVVRR